MPTSGELVKAATNGALMEVQTLIKNRANIDEKDSVRIWFRGVVNAYYARGLNWELDTFRAYM